MKQLSAEIQLDPEVMTRLTDELGAVYYSYEILIIEMIRSKYSIDRELAIQRQRDTKPEEFAEYNAYAEQCKAKAKEIWERQEAAIKRITGNE